MLMNVKKDFSTLFQIIIETNFFKEQDHPTEGKLMYTNFPIDFNFDNNNKSLHAPNLGEHTDEILCELGYSDIEIKKLVSEGVIKLFNQT